MFFLGSREFTRPSDARVTTAHPATATARRPLAPAEAPASAAERAPRGGEAAARAASGAARALASRELAATPAACDPVGPVQAGTPEPVRSPAPLARAREAQAQCSGRAVKDRPAWPPPPTPGRPGPASEPRLRRGRCRRQYGDAGAQPRKTPFAASGVIHCSATRSERPQPRPSQGPERSGASAARGAPGRRHSSRALRRRPLLPPASPRTTRRARP